MSPIETPPFLFDIWVSEDNQIEAPERHELDFSGQRTLYPNKVVTYQAPGSDDPLTSPDGAVILGHRVYHRVTIALMEPPTPDDPLTSERKVEIFQEILDSETEDRERRKAEANFIRTMLASQMPPRRAPEHDPDCPNHPVRKKPN